MSNTQDTRFLLKTRLQWLMIIRVVVAIIFLSTTTWFQIKKVLFFDVNLYPLYSIVIIICAASIFYAIVMRWINNLTLFTYFQILADVIIITAAVYITGGMGSVLSFLYFFTIISGSILLNRRGGFYAASASALSYGILIDADFYNLLPDKYQIIIWNIARTREEFLTTLFTNIAAFFTIAFLSGYLAERLSKVEKELKDKSVDFKRLESLNKYIVENIASGIITVDSELKITSFNRAAESITGYSLREVYNQGLDRFFSGLSENNVFKEDVLFSSRIAMPFEHRDGNKLYLGFTISKMKDESGKETGHIIIVQDLTKLKEMEDRMRRAEKLKSLGELSAGIAHEIRNPLASISGSIQVLKDDLKLEGDDSHLMDIVLRETNRLNALVTDFLLFAKPAPLKKAAVNVKDLIENTLEMFKNSPDVGNIDISTELEDGLFVSADQRQMQQVFWNLFLNAHHAMIEGGRLKISAKGKSQKAERDKDFIEITISDTGHGIDAEDINNIFDPFFSTKDGGTGLGLAIVHRIIETHNGTISVKSEKGSGTTFIINLPLTKEG
ncbi:MAG: PAS domain S-box protein [Deltaproteobacteria bacterium]|nr:PAS domain S-box protein [Deltaproteobacteria bacterium]